MKYDCVVVGGGLAGSLAALALAKKGQTVAFIAANSANTDGRTTALMDQSLRFLAELGIWDEIKPISAPLSTMRIIDGTKRLLRGPTVSFASNDIGLDAFGYNIPNAQLLEVLGRAIEENGGITRIDAKVIDLGAKEHPVAVILDNGQTVLSEFVVAADGRNSIIRETMGISVRRWSYPQTAVVMNFSHSRPHGNISTEFHTESGPFTQVPLAGNRSSLVWVNRPVDAERLLSLSLTELSRNVEERMQSILGQVNVEPGIQAWPLSGMTANHFGRGPVVLVGEAGHVFPPIGAQGLNLSLRDIMTLLALVEDGKSSLSTVGDRYDRKRRADVISRTASVDLLNRSLLSDFLPVQMLRSTGLQVLKSVTPLRHLVMREGIEPGAAFRSIPAMLREQIRKKRA